MSNPLLDGEVHSHQIDGWSVSWESKSTYRHWCHQVKDQTWGNLLVIMFNPGSLSGAGCNLRKDSTLRILREVGAAAKLNTFVINLFDYASPSPNALFNSWHLRDSNDLVFSKLNCVGLQSYICAYGDYENWGVQNQAIKDRILLIKNTVKELREIVLPKNKSGTPKHPMTWQRQKIKSQIAELLVTNA